jgi:hypothetical protein
MPLQTGGTYKMLLVTRRQELELVNPNMDSLTPGIALGFIKGTDLHVPVV